MEDITKRLNEKLGCTDWVPTPCISKSSDYSRPSEIPTYPTGKPIVIQLSRPVLEGIESKARVYGTTAAMFSGVLVNIADSIIHSRLYDKPIVYKDHFDPTSTLWSIILNNCTSDANDREFSAVILQCDGVQFAHECSAFEMGIDFEVLLERLVCVGYKALDSVICHAPAASREEVIAGFIAKHEKELGEFLDGGDA